MDPVVAKVNANGRTEPGQGRVPGECINTEGSVDVNIGGEQKPSQESSSMKDRSNINVFVLY